jgi:peptide/nickel transport system substrate-binding protein
MWWGATRPALDRIVFRFLASSASLIDALANGEVDLITPQANVDLLARARATPGLLVRLGASADWEAVTYNTRSPVLSDPLVRRAIASAIDRNAVVDVAVKPISSTAAPLGNFVFMPNQAGVYQPHDAAYARPDPAATERLLGQAGWTRAGGGWTKEGETLRLTLSTTPGEPTRVEQMDLIRSQLEKVGIAVTRDDCVISCLRQRMAGPGPFDITGFGWTGGVSAASTIKAIYETGSSRNFGKWSSPRFDELIRSAVVEADPARQAALANQADQVLWDELPALPLYQKPNLVILRDRFVGPTPNGGGDGVFWNSQEWAAKAAR